MQQRRLGRTGHMSSIVIFGTAAFYQSDQAKADAGLDLALARGINHLDVAPGYGDAQAVVGPWLESRRDRFFLGCKTQERTHEAAWADLRRSLELLRTDVIDLYQFHAVTQFQELEAVFAPDGAIHTFTEARERGLVRYLGITTHGMLAPHIALAALERFDLDTIMFPINPRLYADPDYRAGAERLLDICQARDVGVQVIKSIAHQPWGERERTYSTWYEPYDDEAIEPSVRFVLSQPVTALASAADVKLLPLIFDAADSFSPMPPDKQEALIAERARDALIFES